MITIHLIRHGVTEPNILGNWAGSTDVPITLQAEKDIKELASKYPYPEVSMIYRSPLVRCRQTMEAVYPGRDGIIIDDLKELDFGDYEGAYGLDALEELGIAPISERRLDFQFPGGESFGVCLNRGISAIDQIVKKSEAAGCNEVSAITHSMWISILLKYCLYPKNPEQSLFCGNGHGISILVDQEIWFKERKFQFGGHIPEGAPVPRYEDSAYFKRG